MNRESFIQGFIALGCKPEARTDDFLVFPYVVPVGKFAGEEIRLGLEIKGDAPINPPPGLHVSPRLLPQHPSADLPHPAGGVHASPPALGVDWQYWSRPIQHWKDGERSARQYMAHIRNLFATQ